MRRLSVLTAITALVAGLLAGLFPGSASAATTYSAAPASSWIPNGTVRAIAVTPTTIYIGGEFTSLRHPYTGAVVTRSHLAAIDRATGNPTSWNPAPNSYDSDEQPPIATIAVGPDGMVYVGGDFTSIGGVTRIHAAAVTPAGAVTSWRADTDASLGHVWDMAVSGTKLYMVGQFNTVNGQSRDGAARVDLSNGAVDAWDAHLSGRAQAVAVTGSTVVLGGTFTAIGGAARSYLGSVDTATGAVSSWAPATQCDSGIICRIRDLAVNGSQVYAAIGGEPGGRAAAWTLGMDNPMWKDVTDGEVQTLDYFDGVVYLGGHFSAAIRDSAHQSPNPAVNRNQFAAVDAATGLVLPYALPTSNPALPGLWAIHADASGLRIGGGTTLTSGPFARFLTFAATGVTVPGPVAPPTTTVTVKTKGCKTCLVRVNSRRGSSSWSSPWVKAKGGVTTFSVWTSRTVGLTVQVKAPWERKQKNNAEVVMRYKGKKVGQKVSAKVAAAMKKATSCYAGTSARSLKFTVQVKKVKAG
ncbi:MAG: hypothetical protein WAW88_01870, partial [Nocardioides sp.]